MPKNKTNYTTDIAHCGGEDCDIRDKCMRYQLYIMWENIYRMMGENKSVLFIIPPAYNPKTKQCKMFKLINHE